MNSWMTEVSSLSWPTSFSSRMAVLSVNPLNGPKASTIDGAAPESWHATKSGDPSIRDVISPLITRKDKLCIRRQRKAGRVGGWGPAKRGKKQQRVRHFSTAVSMADGHVFFSASANLKELSASCWLNSADDPSVIWRRLWFSSVPLVYFCDFPSARLLLFVIFTWLDVQFS